MTDSKLLTPVLLVIFLCATLLNVALGISVITLCGVSSLLWEWGPEWLNTLGILCVLAISFYNRPVTMTCLTLFLILLWWQAPRS